MAEQPSGGPAEEVPKGMQGRSGARMGVAPITRLSFGSAAMLLVACVTAQSTGPGASSSDQQASGGAERRTIRGREYVRDASGHWQPVSEVNVAQLAVDAAQEPDPMWQAVLQARAQLHAQAGTRRSITPEWLAEHRLRASAAALEYCRVAAQVSARNPTYRPELPALLEEGCLWGLDGTIACHDRGAPERCAGIHIVQATLDALAAVRSPTELLRASVERARARFAEGIHARTVAAQMEECPGPLSAPERDRAGPAEDARLSCERLTCLSRIADGLPSSSRERFEKARGAMSANEFARSPAYLSMLGSTEGRDPAFGTLLFLETQREDLYAQVTGASSYTSYEAAVTGAQARVVVLECLGTFRDAAAVLVRVRDRLVALQAALDEERRCTADPVCRQQRERRDQLAEVTGALCEATYSLRDSRGDMRAIRRRARRFGVINLRDVSDTADYIESLEAEIRELRPEYRRLAGRDFSEQGARCADVLGE